MEVSNDEDNKVIVDIPPGEGEMKINESENRQVGADMDKKIESDQNPCKNGAVDDEIQDDHSERGLAQSHSDRGLALAQSVGEQAGYIDKYYRELLRDLRYSNSHVSQYGTETWTLLLKNGAYMHKTDGGKTVLHIAAENGRQLFVREIVRQAPHLLTAKSLNGDTALHLAAKGGHSDCLKMLIRAHFRNSENLEEEALRRKILEQNKNGNTFLHEILINNHMLPMKLLLGHFSYFKEMAFMTNNENKSCLYLAIEVGYKSAVNELLTFIPSDSNYVPQGKSVLLAAIIKRDEGILDTLLTKKPEWVHLRDSEGRIPLHYAASIGYVSGVRYLLGRCDSCVLEVDRNGLSPIHLASYAGRVSVVHELLKSKYCLDPRDVLIDSAGRNILHLAVLSGKFYVVLYILEVSSRHEGLEKMINSQDHAGNTPLHLATLYCHLKIVLALTWDKRVDLTLLNRKGQTALDAIVPGENVSLKKLLTWTALTSAGARHAQPKSSTIKVPPSQDIDISLQQEKPIKNPYKDTIGTLLVVSTLIITVTFASGFTMPGGTNSAGEAVMLHHIWFKLFIFCITVSMYGAITATLILIWAQLGDVYLAFFSIEVVNSLLAVTLTTLSLAFLAAVHLVVKDLSWLATASLVLSFLSIFSMVLLFMLVFWFPSASRIPLVRYASYYPFLMMASLIKYYESRPY